MTYNVIYRMIFFHCSQRKLGMKDEDKNIMKYEIVELKEKKIVGFGARTSNDAADMGKIIGEQWQKLYAPENVARIENRVNQYAIGLYSDYDEDGYQITAGFEVSEVKEIDSMLVKIIPAGKYAKFSVHGDHVKAVAQSWQEIWATPLERTYTGDYEEYLSVEDIDIYIAIK